MAAVLRPNKPNTHLPLPSLQTTAPTKMTAFIYGFSGAGKSFLLRSLVESELLYPALILVCDAGHATYIDLADNEKLTVVPTPGLGAVQKMTQWLLTNKHPYKTVAIDNVSEAYRTSLLDMARKRVAEKGRGELYALEQADYGYARNQFHGVISDFAMTFPGNVIATALAVEMGDEMSGLTYIEPNLAGKLNAEVPGFFDLVGFLSMKTPSAAERREAAKLNKPEPKSQRILRVAQSSTVRQARNRGDKFPDEIVSPNLARMFKTFIGVKPKE